VNPIPLVDIGTTLEFCTDDPVYTLNTGTPAGGTYSGTALNGNTFDPGIGHGTYHYQYTYQISATGCTATASDSIIVYSLPVVTIPDYPDMCLSSLPFTLSGGLPPGGYYSGTAVVNSTFDPGISGSFEVVYTYTDTSSQCSNTAADSISVFPLPDPVLPAEVFFCEGTSTNIDAGPGYMAYLWSDGSASQSITVNTVGNYGLTVTDHNNCQSFPDSVLATMHPKPAVDLGGDTSVCLGDVAVFNAGSGFSAYLWQDGSDGPVYYAGSSGVYWCRVTDALNCTGTDSVRLQILPVPYVELGDSLYICNGSTVMLEAGQGDGQFTYEWHDGTTGSYHIAYETGLYWVVVGNDACSATDSVMVLECTNIWVPTAFTPNNDGQNEYFKAESSEELIKFQLYIYNRLGQLIFSADNISQKWDGTFRGQACPEDVYTWVIYFDRRGNNPLEQEGTMRGHVTLLR
jgi:gliding motility-associated-like protein